MKQITLMLTLAAFGACVVLGCVKRSEPANSPILPPTESTPKNSAVKPIKSPGITEADDSLGTWLAVNPMRIKMRSMWVSCGEINAMASGAHGVIDFDTLESNAENIARKAKAFGDMWEVIRDANREMATQAKAGDWFESRFQSQRVWSACTDCHVENWSLETRGFLPETIEGWIDDGNSLGDVPYGNLRLSSTPHFLQIMFRMVGFLQRAIGAIDNNDEKVVLTSAQAIHEMANEQLELWRSVERHARKIVETAARNDVLGIDASYGKMTENCRTCHEKYVQDERLPLNPLPWKYGND
ncbi:MAG: hypothetical protein K8I27_02540 [Planctomycetes bacterium]|nr:hypothetical protein [Planctomycetota bacterium]